MTNIVLYSGGLDSYIGLWMLRRERPPAGSWIPVYFNLDTQYTLKELTYIPKPQGFTVNKDILNVSTLERIDGYVPQRNVMLCAAAQAAYDASSIVLCSVMDDVYADNNLKFHKQMSGLLSNTAGMFVNVFSPFIYDHGTGIPKGLTKAQAVKQYMKMGGDPNMLRLTVSCYAAKTVSCGECKACIRRTEALEANGIDPTRPGSAS